MAANPPAAAVVLLDEDRPNSMSVDALRAICITPGLSTDNFLYSRDDTPFGAGTYGKVFRATSLRDPNEVVAVKVTSEQYTGSAQKYLREPFFLSLANRRVPRHPNLLHFHSAYEEAVGFYPHSRVALRQLTVVTTFAPGGSLINHIVRSPAFQSGGGYTERFVAQIMRTLVDAVSALHKAGILHLDLKPDNILLREPPAADTAFSPSRDLVLCDVGMAATVVEAAEAPASQKAHHHGTQAYVAPEQHFFPHKWGTASDVWGLGAIMFALLTGDYPFGDKGQGQCPPRSAYERYEPRMCVRSSARDMWANLTEEARDLVRKMLTFDASARITLDAVKVHPWMQLGADVVPDSMSSRGTASLSGTVRNLSVRSQAQDFVDIVTGAVSAAAAFIGGLMGPPAPGGGAGAVALSPAGSWVDSPGVGPMTSDEFSKLKAAFLAKAGEGGSVDRPTFAVLLKLVGLELEPGMADRVFTMLDKDGNGKVDYRELLAGVQALSSGDETTLDFVFNLFDSGKGFMDRAEMRTLVSATGLSGRGQGMLTSTARPGGGAPARGAGTRAATPPAAADEDGQVGAEGAGADVDALATHAVTDLFDRIDTNGDGRVDREEFRAAARADPTLNAILMKPLKALAQAHAQTAREREAKQQMEDAVRAMARA